MDRPDGVVVLRQLVAEAEDGNGLGLGQALVVGAELLAELLQSCGGEERRSESKPHCSLRFAVEDTSPVVQIVQVSGLQVLQLDLKVLEQGPPLGVGLNLGLGARDAEPHEAADGHHCSQERTTTIGHRRLGQKWSCRRSGNDS